MNRLKELRQEKGLTQQALADEMGVTKRTYIYWEKGDRQIKPEKAQQLAEYFGVSVGYLLGFNTDKIDEYDIEFHDKIVSRMEKESLVKFIDFMCELDFMLSDKQLELFYNQLTETSKINHEFLRFNSDKTRELEYSIYHYYMPDRNFRLSYKDLYDDETIDNQLHQYRKILEGDPEFLDRNRFFTKTPDN